MHFQTNSTEYVLHMQVSSPQNEKKTDLLVLSLRAGDDVKKLDYLLGNIVPRATILEWNGF